MQSMIYNPLEEFETKFKNLHLNNTKSFFEELVKKSGVDVEENRKTVQKYNQIKDNLKQLKKKLNLWRLFRVLMIITLILIPLVILKITPKIKELRAEIENADKRMDELFSLANKQMQPLNSLFTDKDALKIIEKTIPSLSFAPNFSYEQEKNMVANYDFSDYIDENQSTVDILAGEYNENPFVFENKLIHRMGTETYHGYKTITWTESYIGSDGKRHTRVRSQTLHASVIKPKPFYRNQVVLHYCAQGGPDLSFSRDATFLDDKSERALERYIKKGEKRLKKLTDDAIEDNLAFTSMANSDFEVLFDALDRNDEVQFRTLFTPLAQTNMVDLILSKTYYGDDFNFIKRKRTNTIITSHSQGRAFSLNAVSYASYSFDIIKEQFINENTEFFKAVYFDFAPVWAIPIYQERPVHSLDPIPDYMQTYSYKECESLANRVNKEHVVHPNTKTKAILKSSFVKSNGATDEICVTASSYDIIKRVDYVSVLGGDGYWHNVAVPWDDYIPLYASNNFSVAPAEQSQDKQILARKNDLCMYN